MRFNSVWLKKHVSFKVIKYVIYIFACLSLIMFCNKPKSKTRKNIRKLSYVYSVSYKTDSKLHADIINCYFDRRTELPTSNLGTFLFKNVPINNSINWHRPINHPGGDKTYVVLIWKYWNWLKNRHIYSFNSKRKMDPLQECSVKNCKFTGDNDAMSSADAVIVHVQRGLFPNATLRNSKQRWVFLNDESPVYSFKRAKYSSKILNQISNMFNWSMTYRSDSDVPVPYGRTMPLKKPILNQITEESLASLVPYWKIKRTDVLASILISHCAVPSRTRYLNKLQDYLTVDVYGKCSKDKKTRCPGHYKSDCQVISEYYFYLSFENSQCDEYLTEKLFNNAYSKGSIPIIMGPTVDQCKMLLPPESFLHVDEYDNPEELANHMVEISKNSRKFLAFHTWRNHFYVANEHGYFGTKSYHLCRICEALNYNDQKVKYYDQESLKKFFDPTFSCR